MINRIGDSNYTNPYTRSPIKTGGADEKAPAFLLNYDEEGVVWDRGNDGKKKESMDSKVKAEPDGKERKRENADIYIPSNAVIKSEEKQENSESFMKVLTNIFESVKKAISKAFEYIWYGDDKAAGHENNKESDIDDNAEEAIEESEIEEPEIEEPEIEESGIKETGIKEAKKDTFIDDNRTNADSRINGTVAANARKLRRRTEFDRRLSEARKGMDGTLAKNTDLLTTYDRRGHIREVSATDSGKLLRGDKSIKL